MLISTCAMYDWGGQRAIVTVERFNVKQFSELMIYMDCREVYGIWIVER